MQNIVLMLGSLLLAASVMGLYWAVYRIVAGPRNEGQIGYFDAADREKLRAGSKTYSYFEPLIDDLVQFMPAENSNASRRLADALRFLPQQLPWSPRVLQATKLIEGLGIGLVIGCLMSVMASWLVAAIAGCILASMYYKFSIDSFIKQADQRRQLIKLRMPFAIDLMALMMDAGATFRTSLKAVVQENRNHPLGDELGLVMLWIEDGGKEEISALRDFSARINDDDVRDLVAAIAQGAKLGNELSTVFQIQAEQMRLKRSQWAEKATAEAQLKMTGPGMLTALACMLIIAAPVLLMLTNLF